MFNRTNWKCCSDWGQRVGEKLLFFLMVIAPITGTQRSQRPCIHKWVIWRYYIVFLVVCYATLHPAMSVRWWVGWLISWLVGQSPYGQRPWGGWWPMLSHKWGIFSAFSSSVRLSVRPPPRRMDGLTKEEKIPHIFESIGHGPLRGRCPASFLNFNHNLLKHELLTAFRKIFQMRPTAFY